jgi:quercetin dioxygenase-like cupin family protein
MNMNSPQEPSLPLQPPDAALDAAWVGTLAQGLRVSQDTVLSPQAALSVKTRLMQRIAAEPAAATAQSATVVSIMRGDAWVNLSKKIQVKVLHDDGITLSWLLKLLPGGRLPEHDHADGAEECMVLEGQLSINGDVFVCGDYQIAHPGSVHYEVSSQEGALVFLKSPSSRRNSLIPG